MEMKGRNMEKYKGYYLIPISKQDVSKKWNVIIEIQKKTNGMKSIGRIRFEDPIKYILEIEAKNER